jgi:hypothetical protein
MMKKVTKSQVIAQLKKLEGDQELQVSLFPSKCGPANTAWVKGYETSLTKDALTIEYPDNEQLKNLTKFDSLVNDFSYYNCNSELGNRVHFYINE